MASKQKRKRNIWPTHQMHLLFEVREGKIQHLRGSRKNSHVLEEIRVIFSEHNFSVSTDEIKVRIQNLTARYQKEKRAIGPSGRSPSVWPNYDRVHRILGSFRIHNVDDVVEESISDDDGIHKEWLNETILSPNYIPNDEEGLNESETTVTSSSSSSSRRTAAKKRSIINVQQEMLIEFKKNNEFLETELEQLRETDEKLIILEQERNQLLREMTESTKEFNKALIKLLNK